LTELEILEVTFDNLDLKENIYCTTASLSQKPTLSFLFIGANCTETREFIPPKLGFDDCILVTDNHDTQK
jgi:hypothetical protein